MIGDDMVTVVEEDRGEILRRERKAGRCVRQKERGQEYVTV